MAKRGKGKSGKKWGGGGVVESIEAKLESKVTWAFLIRKSAVVLYGCCSIAISSVVMSFCMPERQTKIALVSTHYSVPFTNQEQFSLY